MQKIKDKKIKDDFEKKLLILYSSDWIESELLL
jgi:hypothetical protein